MLFEACTKGTQVGGKVESMNYIALFRGINVGGKNIVAMARLKEMFQTLGFVAVRTYIQSGNVIFEAEETKQRAKKSIEQAFLKTFGFSAAVMLRTTAEFDAVVAQLPFSQLEQQAAAQNDPSVEHLYVYFLEDEKSGEKIKPFTEGYAGEDKVYARTQELYLLCKSSIRLSKLAAMLGKAKKGMTVRNWKTVLKIQALYRD